MRFQLYGLKNERGFTMVELLAVLGVVVVVGAVASAIIFSSLRAATKANQVNIVRQNGNFAILQMSRTIQYAKSFDGVSINNTDYINDCSAPLIPGPTPTAIPTITKYYSIKVTLFDQSQVTFSCSPASSPNDLTSIVQGGNPTSIIDLNAVSITECYFTCTQNYKTDSPDIGIHLILSQKSLSNFAEKSATVPFNTSITMRNPNK